jgi:uncharacterized protein YoxC
MRAIRNYSLKTLFVGLCSFLLGLFLCSLLTTSHVAGTVDTLKADLQSVLSQNEQLLHKVKEMKQRHKHKLEGVQNTWQGVQDKCDERQVQHAQVQKEHASLLRKKDHDLTRLMKLVDAAKQDARTSTPCATCAPPKECPKLMTEKKQQKEEIVHDLKDYGDQVYKESQKRRQDYEKKLDNGRKSVAVHIVSHTHWDREWYRSLEEFNRLLVTIVDGIVRELGKSNSGVEHFHLDGQSILLEDYLRSRKEGEGLMKALINNNQLGAGPWYTQPDEFLVSGESLIRNLFYGMKTVKDLVRVYSCCCVILTYVCQGGKVLSMVGHVPDQFGHTSQMPQIFLGFDLVAASTMRGE